MKRLCLLLCFGCSAPAVVSSGSSGDGGAAPARGDAAAFFSLPPATDARPPDVAACSRSVHLTAVSIARPVPFDVVIVADNSDSLSWSRSSLSAGLENLLARVHGHEARFFVLTTTQYGASSQSAVSLFSEKPLVTWRDSVTGLPYANPVTEYKQACTDGKGAPMICPTTLLGFTEAPAFKLEGTWQFQMPPPVAAITPQMTAAELLVQQKRVVDAVLALGGGGAQQEQPICTLSRYLTQKPEALPKHVVFIVLSDEDDTSVSEACLAGHQVSKLPAQFAARESCQTNCSGYDYYTSRPRVEQQVEFTCLPVDDLGTVHPERASNKVIQTYKSCSLPGSADCSAAQMDKATLECGGGNQVKNCKFTCGPVQGSVSCSLERPTDAVDLCSTPFDERGMHYQNLLDYCARTAGGTGWSMCSRQGWKPSTMVPLQQQESTTLIVPTAHTTGQMIDAFKSSAARLFGPRSHSVESIILDPAFSCPLKPGQSFAPNLRVLASSQDDVFPLCQDYAPALARVAGFADYLVQNDFPLDLNPYEDVDSVMVMDRAGMRRSVLKPRFRYDRAAKSLHFDPGVLGAQDESLSVNVARYCEVVK